MTTPSIEQLLFRLQQKTLVQALPTMSSDAKSALLTSILSFDIATLESQIALCKNEIPVAIQYSPLTQYILAESLQNTDAAEALLRSGKVGTIILAGGQGTRLGYDKPKGLFPISLIKHKSLFERLIDRAKAVQAAYGKAPEIAIMTSPSTHQETVDHIKSLKSSDVHVNIFCQKELPLLHDDGALSVDESYSLRSGPDGNGALFWHFAESGLFELWKKRGIEYISVVQIDNPLADPFSLRLLQAHVQTNKEITAASVFRNDPEEKVGVFVETRSADKVSGHAVIEYSEMLQQDFYGVDKRGNLLYGLANISYFVFSSSFVQKLLTNQHCTLPLHRAKKAVPGTDLSLWKFEYFIFELLGKSSSSQIALFDRKECFAPLKSASGPSGISSVQQALLEQDRRQYCVLSGVEVATDRLFELDMAFYYPTKEQKAKWKGTALPQSSYIEI
jgi:UDP-N-acetylglucosamine/UDP-N-acetylgalactosamine diphosphorylase